MDAPCPICDRPLGTVMVEDHHLIPKELGGKITITLHRICHRKLHATFTNREMLHVYNNIPTIRAHEEIQKFVQWIRNKAPTFYLKNDETTERRNKRRR